MSADFYEGIAGRYDEIVGGASRAGAAAGMADWLVRAHGARRVLDVACGTGLHALALAERGVQVVAADASKSMLDRARASAEDAARRVEWVHARMESIAESVAGPFDAVLCLGNSLPHLLADAQLRSALRGFRGLTADAGVAVVQMLNYDRILARRERIVGVTRHGHSEYVRFYDFLSRRVRFNVLELRWRGEQCEHVWRQTELRPYRSGELSDAFVEAGFQRPALYAGLSGDGFRPPDSEVLLLVARPCRGSDC